MCVHRLILFALLLLLMVSLAALPGQTASASTQVMLGDPFVRFAQFNASLNRNAEGQLITDLSSPSSSSPTVAQAQNVAEIIQRIQPDVLLINEFDYEPTGRAARLFNDNFLAVSQNGADPISYPYVYVAPSNTGIPSGFDLDNNGTVVTTPGAPGYGNDAFGFGNFPGQFGMILYSKYPIDTANVRTFQHFLWKDMPGALLPTDPATGQPWYAPEELAIFRLSSKSHWDVPIKVGDRTIHALVSHPTPPVFDGPEDRNGTRNHDEIRLWADYVTPGKGGYIYDDNGKRGGLTPGASFVIMGDQNADPNDGDSVDNAILQLLDSLLINTSVAPTSPGGPQQAELQGGANLTHKTPPQFDTADFADTTPGNLRTDYVLPSRNLRIADAAVFWPLNTDPLFRLVGVFDRTLPGGFPSSDHRAIWVDVDLNRVLDDFNRNDGPLGRSWRGPEGLGGYQIISKQLDVVGGGPIYWRHSFGSDQQAFVTLARVDSDAVHQSLLLKVQGGDWRKGAIAVAYAGGEVVVETYLPGQSWTTIAGFPATLADGDQLGARALANGSVKVYVNGKPIREADAGAFFADKGGRIGLWFIEAGDTALDDFGGGTVE